MQAQIEALRFPKESFTIDSISVNTAQTQVQVVYKLYRNIAYVSKPIDVNYQSLDVYVPLHINNETIDASNAPIVLYILSDNFMSVATNVDAQVQTQPQITTAAALHDEQAQVALASGFVLVVPGCRGSEIRNSNGLFTGKAPAPIVDMKAAVRYIRHNKGTLPGNSNHIVALGCGSGGALAALLGTSGNNSLYTPYLQELAAAQSSDNIFGSACYSPSIDLENADMAYEWLFGTVPLKKAVVNQNISRQLITLYTAYVESLALQGKDGFGRITAENFKKYLLVYYIFPAAEDFLNQLSAEKRDVYLAENPWILYSNQRVSFSFDEYVMHVGRLKSVPAFDGVDLKQPETQLFGSPTVNARHFTQFTQQLTTGNKQAVVDKDLLKIVGMMNPMNFIEVSSNCAQYWWLRTGSSDNVNPQVTLIQLATNLENKQKSVNCRLNWNSAECYDNQPEQLMQWILESVNK
ncbi:MAG: alpha/beta hydrolase [Bacteroidales bacterium]|nr:alpha/beta hydrolase [Bacteroidales bacterium]